MAFQTVNGKEVFVIDFDKMPKLPIHDGGLTMMTPYAKALNEAFEQGIITEPGKYAIEINDSRWNIYAVNDEGNDR